MLPSTSMPFSRDRPLRRDRRACDAGRACRGSVAAALQLRRLVAAVAVSVLLLAPRPAVAQVRTAQEYQLKAAFVFNFLKFVDWPAHRFPDAGTPVVIGVVGESPTGDALRLAVQSRTINGRAVVVTTVDTPAAARSAHLLLVPAGEDKRLDQWLAGLEGAAVLTVGETPAFAQRGGMFTFGLEGDKLRFEINMDAVEREKLKVSAQLQKLARSVQRKAPKEAP
jgi:hypothetical protein